MRPFFICLSLFVSIATEGQLNLEPGLKIHSSVIIRKTLYKLNALQDLSAPIIEISGENIVIDFNNAMLKGSNGKQFPDEFYGLAILVKDGKNITIKNLHAKGYKIALMAKNVEGLKIEHCDLSYNYRQHLNSSQEKEDISDWMSYHQNEKDEWTRYGAAIYLRNCDKAIIHDNQVTGGQCALMMTQCNDGMIYNNDFSFNSGIGIGLYRSSGNKLMYNRLDFNVRGYSEGIYNRGQDSGAILVFEQCNNNVFAYNSATHSGDGFFLWAGQTTMDTGTGGCNNNIIFSNDFSYAPTNGVEVTFSRNFIYANKIFECDHGVWGGYSFHSEISGNIFSDNRIGIAIEHGQHNQIIGNEFRNDKEGIRLWARKQQPPDWVYAQKRDTRSANYLIAGNRFEGVMNPLNISLTDSLYIRDNFFKGDETRYKFGELVTNIDSSDKYLGYLRGKVDSSIFLDLPEDLPYKSRKWILNKKIGRKEIRITEWGPYDFRYPILWRTNPVDTSGLLKFEVLGPQGKWKLINSRGVNQISTRAGSFPLTITAKKIAGSKDDILLQLEYVGQKFTDQFGQFVSAGKPYRFSFRDSRVPLRWAVKWYSYDSVSNPFSDPANWNKIIGQSPILEEVSKALDYAWWGGLTVKGKQVERFVTQAAAEIDVLPGLYEMSVTWDDAVRVYLDGKLILDEWDPSKYKFDESPNRKLQLRLTGNHLLRVDHVELGGFATLNLKLKRL